ncbi:MAG: phosphotransferase [Lautropia sp.]|nr:phosphotransferase [Lautropia sp.]
MSHSTSLSAHGQPATPAASGHDSRLTDLKSWLTSLPIARALDIDSLMPASSDASFRRYFRLQADASALRAASFAETENTLIVMDAPPPQEDCRPFVHAAQVFGAAGMTVPTVHATDLTRGFLLLGDLGQQTYQSQLDQHSAPRLYAAASEALVRLQTASRTGVFPDYDRALLMRELMLYPEWYVAHHKGITLTEQQHQTLMEGFERILTRVLAQPRGYVHRDYHSRNLMVLAPPRLPGVLDFQDAVYGPLTYDLVSLWRDAYISWDEEQVLDGCIRHWERARAAGLPVPADFSDFYRDIEWMGLQRHLKVLGIFARLYHRDGKPAYLQDIPRVARYVHAALRRYDELAPLCRLFETIEGIDTRHIHTF